MSSVEEIIKNLVDNGAFGPVKYVSSNVKNDVDKGAQFASVISFNTITVNDGAKNLDYHIVIKRKHVSDEAKRLFLSDVAFQNELIMYTKILPLLNANKLNLFPKLYKEMEFSDNALIFENLQFEGYMLTKEKIFLDYEHLELALKKLGQFHALSYRAKRNHKDEFFKLATELIETKFTGGSKTERTKFLYPCMLRGIKPLLEKNVEVDILSQISNKLKNLVDAADAVIKPEEPYSVICHGDFCRNNMFFKYDNGKPIDIKFFDLQNSVYTSPTIDLSFFLYMNTTVAIRDHYWGKLLNIYWSSLTESEPDVGFTFEQFLEHFSERAIYGYFPTCFFLPGSMDENSLLVEEFVLLDEDEQVRQMLLKAGDEGTKAISEIVQHLLDKRYLHKFLELYSS